MIVRWNRPRSIYQCSNMAPRLSGENSVNFLRLFVRFNSQKRLWYKEKNTKYGSCPESLGAMSEYWYIERGLFLPQVKTVRLHEVAHQRPRTVTYHYRLFSAFRSIRLGTHLARRRPTRRLGRSVSEAVKRIDKRKVAHQGSGWRNYEFSEWCLLLIGSLLKIVFMVRILLPKLPYPWFRSRLGVGDLWKVNTCKRQCIQRCTCRNFRRDEFASVALS